MRPHVGAVRGENIGSRVAAVEVLVLCLFEARACVAACDRQESSAGAATALSALASLHAGPRGG